mgnify:FL=1
MDVVVKEGYISYKGKLYHAGEVAHIPKTAAQKLFGAGLVEAPANKTMEEIDSPADSSPEEEEESGEELPAPDSKAMERK